MSGTVPPAVLAAFGVSGTPEPVTGGQGRTWRIDGVVLKPTGLPEETAWRAEVLASLPSSPRFRVARPVRARDGGWVAYGWEAWLEEAGSPDPGRYDEVLRTGEALHEALRDLPRPAFLDVRADPWSVGERMAWELEPIDAEPEWLRLLEPLAAVRRPVELPAQPVHGDLGGNVLFSDGLQPAVIDWPVYYRPPAWALAVAVVDALTWNGAPPALVDRWAHQPEWDQMLIRALIFRIATNEGFRRAGWPVKERPDHHHVVAQILRDRHTSHRSGSRA